MQWERLICPALQDFDKASGSKLLVDIHHLRDANSEPRHKRVNQHLGAIGRAVQFSLQPPIGEDDIEVECAAPAVLRDVCYAVEAHDIEGEAAESGDDSRIFANA